MKLDGKPLILVFIAFILGLLQSYIILRVTKPEEEVKTFAAENTIEDTSENS